MEYTREKLIEICAKGRVPYKKWLNRDSCSSQEKLMMAGLLLESGCDFRVRTEQTHPGDKSCVTDDRTIWIEIFYDEWEDGEGWHLFYLPTENRLEECKGSDWC